MFSPDMCPVGYSFMWDLTISLATVLCLLYYLLLFAVQGISYNIMIIGLKRANLERNWALESKGFRRPQKDSNEG